MSRARQQAAARVWTFWRCRKHLCAVVSVDGPADGRPGRQAGSGSRLETERRRCGTSAVPGLRPSNLFLMQPTPLRAWLLTAGPSALMRILAAYGYAAAAS